MRNILVVLSLTCALALANEQDIVGQKARYQLDKDPNRTSSMIKSGRVDVEVTQFLTAAYEVLLNYKFQVAIMGSQEGSQANEVDAEYFAAEFLENLRKTGHYEGAHFKADHLGYADAKNLDGKVYLHCDKVLMYDIKEPTAFHAMLAEPLAVERADIKDLKILAHVFPGVPVLGGVKIDASGNYNGMPVKAGGDYLP